ncbi:MAG TPA: nitroreductase family deazaflavin-dependent oxidoreductase [Ktedonobacterales bacterium]|nr:nitroreductase family deazaflavin-dependent oxidoreductase [Ktedonobacterales bacterium]
MAQRTKRLSMFALIVYNLTGGRIQLGDLQDPVGILALTTTGRKSGQPRSVSLVYIKHASAYVVAASNAGRDTHPGWYFNLRSNPQGEVRIKGRRFVATAEVADAGQRQQLWDQLVEAAPMFARYQQKTHREIPMMFLRPAGEEGSLHAV